MLTRLDKLHGKVKLVLLLEFGGKWVDLCTRHWREETEAGSSARTFPRIPLQPSSSRDQAMSQELEYPPKRQW